MTEIYKTISDWIDKSNEKVGVKFEPVKHGFICLSCDQFYTFWTDAVACCIFCSHCNKKVKRGGHSCFTETDAMLPEEHLAKCNICHCFHEPHCR